MKIRNIELEKRIVVPPMARYFCKGDGQVTEEMIEYYGKVAQNRNTELLITEHCYIDLRGKAHVNQLSISEDGDIQGLKALTDEIHIHGCYAVAQLAHAGAAAPAAATGSVAEAPSSVLLPPTQVMHTGDGTLPEEMTKERIAELVRKFAEAAVRAQKAGYDGVEIHSAHAYMLNEFYSPLTNTRTDEYGGSLENRLRFHVEALRAIRSAVGGDYCVAVRLGGCDYMPGGNTIIDAVEASKILEAAGADLIDLSGGMCRYTRKGHSEPGYFSDMSKAVKAGVQVPVILTGGVKKLEEAEKLLAEGAADLIGVGRAILADPDWESAGEK